MKQTYEAPKMEQVRLEPATFAGFYRITTPVPGMDTSGQLIIRR